MISVSIACTAVFCCDIYDNVWIRIRKYVQSQYKLLYMISNSIGICKEPLPRIKKILHYVLKFVASENNRMIHKVSPDLQNIEFYPIVHLVVHGNRNIKMKKNRISAVLLSSIFWSLFENPQGKHGKRKVISLIWRKFEGKCMHFSVDGCTSIVFALFFLNDIWHLL